MFRTSGKDGYIWKTCAVNRVESLNLGGKGWWGDDQNGLKSSCMHLEFKYMSPSQLKEINKTPIHMVY
jgi:hypothetical protein